MKNQKTKWFWIILFGVITILAIVPYTRNFLSQGAFYIARPVLLAGNLKDEPIYSYKDYFTRIRTVREENNNLKSENLRLVSKLAELKTLQEELNTFKKAFNTLNIKPSSLIATRVLGTFFDPKGMVLILDGGSKQGIVNGLSVVTEDKILLGKIKEVHDAVSFVSLLKNTETALSVTIRPSNTEALLVGTGDSIKLDLVPNDLPLSEESFVFTNSVGENSIPDLFVGEIFKAEKSSSKPFQEIYVKELISYSKLRTVFVISPF